MSFGLRTWSEAGALQMDTDSFTYQVLHNQLYTLTLGAVITVPVSGFDPAKCVATILPTAPPTLSFNHARDAMPYMSVSSGQIIVRSRNPSEPDTSNGSQIPFRLLVMRYKN